MENLRTTRSGRVTRVPQRYEPIETPVDDYTDSSDENCDSDSDVTSFSQHGVRGSSVEYCGSERRESIDSCESDHTYYAENTASDTDESSDTDGFYSSDEYLSDAQSCESVSGENVRNTENTSDDVSAAKALLYLKASESE